MSRHENDHLNTSLPAELFQVFASDEHIALSQQIGSYIQETARVNYEENGKVLYKKDWQNKGANYTAIYNPENNELGLLLHYKSGNSMVGFAKETLMITDSVSLGDGSTAKMLTWDCNSSFRGVDPQEKNKIFSIFQSRVADHPEYSDEISSLTAEAQELTTTRGTELLTEFAETLQAAQLPEASTSQKFKTHLARKLGKLSRKSP